MWVPHPFAFGWRKDGIEACRLPSRNCCHGNAAARRADIFKPGWVQSLLRTQGSFCAVEPRRARRPGFAPFLGANLGKGRFAEALGFCSRARLQPLRLSNAVYPQPPSGVEPFVQHGRLYAKLTKTKFVCYQEFSSNCHCLQELTGDSCYNPFVFNTTDGTDRAGVGREPGQIFELRPGVTAALPSAFRWRSGRQPGGSLPSKCGLL